MTSEQNLKQAVETLVADKINSLTPVGGGCISHAAILSLESGQELFLKWNVAAPDGFFQAESDGLKELRKCPAVKVPEVFFVAERDGNRPAFIVMEAFKSGESAGSQEMLGRQLAELHKGQSPRFGFTTNNYIGTTVQYNQYHDSWGEFFFTERLCRQAEAGKRADWFDQKMMEVLFSLKDRIINLLMEAEEHPALLHGDLWSGNIMWCKDGPALIDPAVYYGSREADLAMTEMFGGFSSDFYDAYNQEYPLQSGYEERKELLNLYHLMNHANIFGGHYTESVQRFLQNFAAG